MKYIFKGLGIIFTELWEELVDMKDSFIALGFLAGISGLSFAGAFYPVVTGSICLIGLLIFLLYNAYKKGKKDLAD